MRIFGSERMDSMLRRLGLKEGEAIIHPWVNKAIAEERATGTTGRPTPAPHARGRAGSGNGTDRGGPRPAGPRAPWAGTPRNAPCPCGSGRKFKHCHGRV